MYQAEIIQELYNIVGVSGNVFDGLNGFDGGIIKRGGEIVMKKKTKKLLRKRAFKIWVNGTIAYALMYFIFFFLCGGFGWEKDAILPALCLFVPIWGLISIVPLVAFFFPVCMWKHRGKWEDSMSCGRHFND